MIVKSLAAFACLASASVLATAAAAADFSFSFTAPFDSGDTASGSGSITTADADAEGRYRVTAVSGSWVPYQPFEYGGTTFTADPRVINGFDSGAYVPAINDFQAPDLPVYLRLIGGAFAIDPIALFDTGNPGWISFARNADGTYFAPGGEVSASAATLTITQNATGDVPEPATWTMMIAGFGVVGYGMRRRAKVAFA